MITQVTIRRFKRFENETFSLRPFDLLVGRNNCGKSTVLQALAVWQFCIDEFHRSNRKGKSGKQVVLPNFTALPVPEFNLLWKDKTDRIYDGGSRKQQYVLIEIDITWQAREDAGQHSFGVRLRYSSPQTVYAIPAEGWAHFSELDNQRLLPLVAYVPPFSGLEPNEEWRDDGPIRKQIGKAQPGTVLRNLLLRVLERDGGSVDWDELTRVVRSWFSMDLLRPRYRKGVDTEIKCEYKENGERFDIIAGGSGFHQVLTLLAFLYGLRPTTILLDEPDAHLHTNLQREVLDYFLRVSRERGVQFLTATHAEELVRGVDHTSLLVLPSNRRVQSTPPVIVALAEVSNQELAALSPSPYVVYVEGESDERIIRAWAATCGAETWIKSVYFRPLGGGSKSLMKEGADRHFSGVRQLLPDARRLVVFDYDDAATAFHPDVSNPTLWEWKRKNIENYLLVPAAWKRAAAQLLAMSEDSLLMVPLSDDVDRFFAEQNVTLPPGATWREVSANIFQVVDGKRILFEDENSLFQRLRSGSPSVEVSRERVAAAMQPDEIHQDVHEFFSRLQAMVEASQ